MTYQKIKENNYSQYIAMKLWGIAIAVLAIIIIVLLPNLFTNPSNSPALTQSEVEGIAANYVETNFNSTVVTGTEVTANNNGVWSITVTYQQGTGASCKVGKCYWQGPSSMFCRVESSQSLGQCQ